MNATERLIEAVEAYLNEYTWDESVPRGPQYEMQAALQAALEAAKEEQERSPAWLGHCSGCTDPHSEGTHQMGTIEHPDLDNAKEEQGKAEPDEEIERLADECFGNMLNGIKHRPLADLEQKAAKSTISMYRTALRYARDNGYLAPAKEEQAKGSGLDVDAIVQVVKEWHLDWCDSGPANATDFDVLGTNIRKALEDPSGKGSDNS